MLDDADAEEGEINSGDEQIDYVEPYQALERPSASTRPLAHEPRERYQYESDLSEEFSESEDSASDSDDHRPAKRMRRNVCPPRRTPKPVTKQNPWSSVLLEDHIESELKDVGVRHGFRDRTRDVESYNYTLVLESKLEEGLDSESEERIRKKLLELDKKDGGESIVKSEESKPKDFEETLQETHKLLTSRKRKMDQRDPAPRKPSIKQRLQLRVADLDATVDSSEVELAQDMTLKLHEDKMDLILRAIQILGKETAVRLFHETQETENEGGILTADGSRRRTPGGVFLYLLRNDSDIPMEKIREVFSEENRNREKFKRTVRAKRRQAKAESLKQAVAADLKPLPSRYEAMMTRPNQENCEEGEQPDDDNVVDINFECD